MRDLKPRILLLTQDRIKARSIELTLAESDIEEYEIDHVSQTSHAEQIIKERRHNFVFIDVRFGLFEQPIRTSQNRYMIQLIQKLEAEWKREDNLGVCILDFGDYGDAENYDLAWIQTFYANSRVISPNEASDLPDTIGQIVKDPDFTATNWDLKIQYKSPKTPFDETMSEPVEDILRQMFFRNKGTIVVKALEKQGFSNAFLLEIDGEKAGRNRRDIVKFDTDENIQIEREKNQRMGDIGISVPAEVAPNAKSRISPLAAFRMEAVANPKQLSELLEVDQVTDPGGQERVTAIIERTLQELERLHCVEAGFDDNYEFAEHFENDESELRHHEPYVNKIAHYLSNDGKIDRDKKPPTISFIYGKRRYTLNDPTQSQANLGIQPTSTTLFSLTHGDLHAKNILASFPRSADDQINQIVYLIDVTEVKRRASILDYASLEANLVLEAIENDDEAILTRTGFELVEDYYRIVDRTLFVPPKARVARPKYFAKYLPNFLDEIRRRAGKLLSRSPIANEDEQYNIHNLSRTYALALLHMYLRQTRWIAEDIEYFENTPSHHRQYKDKTAFATLLICSSLVDFIQNEPLNTPYNIRTKSSKFSDGEGSAA